MANQTGNIAAKAEQLVRPVIEGLGLRLWDVRFEKEGADWLLRVLIDRDEPLDTDTCEVASRAIDPVLDQADLISQSYFLEVGSPGLGRRLTRDEHFDALAGQKVQAHLIRPGEGGSREVTGTLLGKQGGTVRLATPEGEVEIEAKAAGYFKLCDDEDLFS
ncbi:MAG: ribosome maturation factor RimP [Oscillospiraceae bacterium]